MRVAVLEQRVRELEAAVISGQAPSTSFVIPVVASKSRFFCKYQLILFSSFSILIKLIF